MVNPPATATVQDLNAPFRVMVVEDSAVIRRMITQILDSDPAITVTEKVGDGRAAINAMKVGAFDVIVLDIEMPIMDGLEALPQLLKIDPHARVIMASTLTLKGADISMHALRLGAADYVPKPTTSAEITGTEDFKRELTEKVKALGTYARRAALRRQGITPPARTIHVPQPLGAVTPAAAQKSPVATAPRAQTSASPVTTPVATPMPRTSLPGSGGDFSLRPVPVGVRPSVVAIGSSTGGPQALFQVLSDCGPLSVPILITQHMPAAFTPILASHIAKQCNIPCEEGKDGMTVENGRVYLAPGDFHMLVAREGTNLVLRLNKDAPENFCRPAVDPMMRSVAKAYGKNVLAVILTGMGADGARGCEDIVRAGGGVIAQDEATSVVWGMPGATAAAGVCHAVLPLPSIGGYIRKAVMGGLHEAR